MSADPPPVDRPKPRSVHELIAAGELLSAAEFAVALRLGHAQFGKRERAGAFEAFKVYPPIGTKRFSGVLVGRYLRGEPLEAPSFGRRRRA